MRSKDLESVATTVRFCGASLGTKKSSKTVNNLLKLDMH